MQGKTVPKNVDTGTALVTKANAGKFGQSPVQASSPSW